MKKILETDRLIITLPDMAAFEDVYKLDSDPDVMKYIGNGKIRSREESLSWYKKSIQYAEKYGFSFGLVYEKASGNFIGRAGISHNAYDDSQPDIEIGYRLYKKYWNKGYATELATALIDWGFFHLNIERICGFAQPNNTSSRNILEKIGMHFVREDSYGGEKVIRYEIYKNQGSAYDRIAKDFSNMRSEFYLEKKYLDLFVNYLPKNSQILDVGCGSGHPIAAYLVSQGFQVTGIDASKELLKIAQNKCSSMKQIYGDMRTVKITEKYDGIVEWWALFHVPKEDHSFMISRFANWLKPHGILHFTTGDSEYFETNSDMLNQPISFYSLDAKKYEKLLKDNNFEILLNEYDQDQHMVWIARKMEK